MSEWKTIDSAPKDMPILGYNGEIVTEAMYLDDYEDDDGHTGWCRAGFTDGGMLYYHHNAFEPEPTHWMPLPLPPKDN